MTDKRFRSLAHSSQTRTLQFVDSYVFSAIRALVLERRLPDISVLVRLCNVRTLVFSTRPTRGPHRVGERRRTNLCASAPPLMWLCS